jgi:hypothetical protein
MKKKHNSDRDKLVFENDLKKLKLKAERGADFFETNKDIPPEVESQWLDNIMAYEKSFDKNEVRKVGDLLGNPSLPPVETIPDEDLSAELSKIMELMEQNNITLETLYEVPDREIYRFIREELMEYEMQVIDVPGMFTHFTYEEFHPNDEEDLKRTTEEFLEMLSKKNFEFMDASLSSEVIFQDHLIPCKQFIKQLSNLVDNLELNFQKIEFSSIQINDDKAVLECFLNYEKKAKSDTTINYKENVVFGFVHQYGYWYLHRISIPGLPRL